MKVRRHLVLTGRVQGVGLRYRAKYLADRKYVTGWVKNEWDGTVSMEVQGEEKDIEGFLFKLSTGQFIKVTNMESRKIPVEIESGFSIR